MLHVLRLQEHNSGLVLRTTFGLQAGLEAVFTDVGEELAQELEVEELEGRLRRQGGVLGVDRRSRVGLGDARRL